MSDFITDLTPYAELSRRIIELEAENAALKDRQRQVVTLLDVLLKKDFDQQHQNAALSAQNAELENQLKISMNQNGELGRDILMAKTRSLQLEAEIQLPENQRLLEIRRLEDENAALQSQLDCSVAPEELRQWKEECERLKAPIDMMLFCPACGFQHVDAPEPSGDWTNPTHKSHLCHNCKHIWRPASVATNGVAFVLPGTMDSDPAMPNAHEELTQPNCESTRRRWRRKGMR